MVALQQLLAASNEAVASEIIEANQSQCSSQPGEIKNSYNREQTMQPVRQQRQQIINGDTRTKIS